MSDKIDFVLLWVNGNDPDWMSQKKLFNAVDAEGACENRFRDWDNLQYWFRGIETFAPWVNRIHLVTCGHYPEWLNREHPKLHLVNHSDYIPPQYLPTFNSNVIELLLHKLPDLAEQFVLFNDDMFFTSNVNSGSFFKNGRPCDQALMGIISPSTMFSYIKMNNISVINKHFKKRSVIKKHPLHFFHYRYGLLQNLKNAILCLWEDFSGMNDPHLPIAYNKKTFEDVWAQESELLSSICNHRFREKTDLSHWLFRYWRLMKGEFTPAAQVGKTFLLSTDDRQNAKIYAAIRKGKYKTICINDSDMNIDFERVQKELIGAFDAILPNKSAFEI